MKTTREIHEEQQTELKKDSDAFVDAHVEGEIGDEEAKAVAGGAPIFGKEPPKQPPVAPV